MRRSPRKADRSLQANLAVETDPLLGADGRILPALVRLWTYSMFSGVFAIGVAQLMVSITHTVLPASLVRLGSIGTVVVAAGLAADSVLGHLLAMTSRRRPDAR